MHIQFIAVSISFVFAVQAIEKTPPAFIAIGGAEVLSKDEASSIRGQGIDIDKVIQDLVEANDRHRRIFGKDSKRLLQAIGSAKATKQRVAELDELAKGKGVKGVKFQPLATRLRRVEINGKRQVIQKLQSR